MKIPYSKFKQLPVHVCAVWNRYAYKWGIFIFLLCFDPLFCRICIRGVQEYKGGLKFYVLFLRNRFTTVIQNIHSILKAAKIFEFYFLLLFRFYAYSRLKLMRHASFCSEDRFCKNIDKKIHNWYICSSLSFSCLSIPVLMKL